MSNVEFHKGSEVERGKVEFASDHIQEEAIRFGADVYDLLERQGGSIIAIKTSPNWSSLQLPRVFVGMPCVTNESSYMTGTGKRGKVTRIVAPYTEGKTDHIIQFEYEGDNGETHTVWLKMSELNFS